MFLLAVLLICTRFYYSLSFFSFTAFLGFHFRHDLFQRFDRFGSSRLNRLKQMLSINWKRSFTGLLPVVVYLAELVGIQPQFAGRVMSKASVLSGLHNPVMELINYVKFKLLI